MLRPVLLVLFSAVLVACQSCPKDFPVNTGPCIDPTTCNGADKFCDTANALCCEKTKPPPPPPLVIPTTSATSGPTTTSTPKPTTTTRATTTTRRTPPVRPVIRRLQNTCVDKGPDCIPKAYLCTNKQYYDVMRVQCPKTCGFCSTGGNNNSNKGSGVRPGGSRRCRDLGTDCPSRAYLCSSSLYYQVMSVQCPRTCRRC